MISQFWSLCRACPAMDIDKLHSEYRSTYRWHQYTPKQNQVVRRPPQPINGTVMSAGIDGSDFSRRKKHPDLAHRTNDLFEVSPRPGGGAMEVAVESGRAPRPAARQAASGQARRSKSEGPVTRNPLFQSEYRQQFAPSTCSTTRRTHSHQHRREEGSQESALSGQAQEPKLNVSFPPQAPSSGWNRRQNSLRAREMNEAREPKKSISMGQIQPTGNCPAPGGEAKVAKKPQDINGNSDTVDGPGGGGQTPRSRSPATKIKEHKSEYKNKFRPFSQYEYIGDGKFYNTSTSPPNEIDNPSVRWPKQRQARPENLSGEPWYQEVIELRKTANDYKCRGWGTDLVPPHMSQIYSEQISLHEQAAKRESLSALALAISTPRSMNKDEKEKENQRKSSSPIKHRSSRPRTAPPTGSKKSASRSESARPGSSPAKEPKDKTDSKEAKDSKPSTGRSVSAGSPARKEGAGRPHSAKRQRPNSEAKDKIGEPKKGVSRNSSKAASRDTSRPPSVIDNHIDYFRQPVVKSPPEPTRVKSPEQLLMRSPDPINWTVPLDTRNTFSVTQSVRDSDSARNSPMSDHSSHFDSVSGTAINLGMHSVNEKGSLHYPKVSALAREAKELQGKSNQKKEDVKEEKKTSVSEAPASPFSPKTEDKHPVTEPSPAATEPRVNGTTNGEATNGQAKKEINDKENNKETAKIRNEEKSKQVTAPASNLKCLEDPNFSFDEPPSASPLVKPSPSVDTTANPASDSKPPEPSTAQPKKPSYRVLEDPEMDLPKPKGPGYKVLEDPMMTSIYEPASQEPVKGRPESVGDGARQQFDKFFKGTGN